MNDWIEEHVRCPINRAQWASDDLLTLGTPECRDINERMTHLVNRHVAYGCRPEWERDLLPRAQAEPRRLNAGYPLITYCNDTACSYDYPHAEHSKETSHVV